MYFNPRLPSNQYVYSVSQLQLDSFLVYCPYVTKMATEKLLPNDTRVRYASTQIRGKTYGYMLGEPDEQPLDTILLMHGFPDLGFGWRYQIPHLMSLGYRVLVPDMVGYGRTDAPMELEAYSHASVAEDMKELVKQITGESQQVIIGGHDWGGRIVWDMAQRYPQLVKAVFSVCTPIPEPEDTYVSLEDDIAAGRQANFKYQLQFKGTDLESHVQGTEKLRQFFNAVYNGKTAAGEYGVSADTGIIIDRLPLIKQSELVSENEVAHYAAQYMLRDAPPLRGPLSWYRVHKLNWENQIELKRNGMGKVTMPALFIAAKRDAALPPSLADRLEERVEDLTRAMVDSGHWALCEAAEEVNEKIGSWLKDVAAKLNKAST